MLSRPHTYRILATSASLSSRLSLRPSVSLLPHQGVCARRFYGIDGRSERDGDELVHVHDTVSSGAHIDSLDAYHKVYAESTSDPQSFWRKTAEALIGWQTPFQEVQEGSFANGDIQWFRGGKLNACWNAVDRHAETNPDKVAIIYEADEPGTGRTITYQQLKEEVSRTANVLKSAGARKGDIVCIYMPMVPEAAIAMLACARLGCLHSVVFGGFSTSALKSRMQDAKSRFVITANEGLRAGKRVPLKATVDEAIGDLPFVEKVFVHQRVSDSSVSMVEGRDIDMKEALKLASVECPVTWMESDDPLFVLYTSGSTGSPKGVVHSTGGYLVTAAATHRYVFDYRPDDVYACVADIGWITGHTYIVYGPLCNNATTVMFESLPTYPDHSRYWQLIQDYKVNSFYTSPTAIRSLMKMGAESSVSSYDLSSLRVLGTVGEPINREAWHWFYEHVGKRKCSIVDTYWQTETGGITLTPLPGATPMKPGSAALPFFGMRHTVMDPETGVPAEPCEKGSRSGLLCFSQPWPGMARTVLKDHDRYRNTYFSDHPGHYFTGDSCVLDKDGYIWITGRVDDVINKAGHRMSSSELENVLLASSGCAESAVISVPDDVKGEAIWAFCCPMAGSELSVKNLKMAVRASIGPIAVPDGVVITPSLPKTRSGKVMRRLLRALIMKTDVGDTTTLADQCVLGTLEDAIAVARDQ